MLKYLLSFFDCRMTVLGFVPSEVSAAPYSFFTRSVETGVCILEIHLSLQDCAVVGVTRPVFEDLAFSCYALFD